ncbi:MAG: GNAT family N-acetyltransferase [Chloroflexota bacterium]
MKESLLQKKSSAFICELQNGLVLRRAITEDADELSEFNVRVQSNDPDEPVTWIGLWTKDLLSGNHPTTGPDDFTVVVDPRQEGKIVSTSALISQTWRYEDISFGVGRPELIGTDENYRRRGLAPTQMDVIHEWSRERDQLIQVITGVPFYYRRFGYEMALDLGGSRLFPLDRLRKLKAPAEDDLQVRRASAADLSILQDLYDRHCEASMVCRVRDAAQWHYEMFVANEHTSYHRRFYLVETGDRDQVAGYFTISTHPGHVTIREIAAAPGHSLRAVALRASRHLRDCYSGDGGDGKDARRSLAFALGQDHPAYRALERELVPYADPYAWYVRVPDIRRFLGTIRPVLERRLEEGVMAGYSGSVRLNCTSDSVRMVWEKGKLVAIEEYEPVLFEDGDAIFPGRTFLQLLFGFRNLKELKRAHPDCYVQSDEAYVLLSTLLPRKPSLPVGLI